MDYELTEEGKRYMKKGLPEKRLMDAISEKGSEISEIKGKVKDFGIAIQWCKKHGCAEIRNRKVYKKSDLPEESEDLRKGLEAVAGGKRPSVEVLKTLESRNLVAEIRDDIEKQAEKFVGKDVGRLNEALIKTRKWRDVRLKKYNVKSPGPKIYPGKRHPYVRFLSRVRQRLVEMGFREMTGPTVETEFWNFDALYQPQNHPSRDWTETYSLKNPKKGSLPDKRLVKRVQAAHENGWKTGSTGWGYKWSADKAARLMPRAHTTALSARYLAKGVEVPGKYFSIARCYRPDVIDATHGVEFYQMEGIVVAEDLNFRDMLGLLKGFAVDFAGAKKVRFYPDYYPFTEPSVQISAKHPDLGWVEFGGAGVFREELTKPLGVGQPVIAWGMGIDRFAMYRLGVRDIRNLFSPDLAWLRKMEVIR